MSEALELYLVAPRQVRAGVDPIAARRAAKRPAVPSFGQVADGLIATKSAAWRNAKSEAAWRLSLEVIAAPLRSLPVDRIGVDDVLRIITQFWSTMPETARRTLGRIEAVLDAAAVQGHCSRDNPARWRGRLSHVLPAPGRARSHHAAVDYRDAPALVARLCEVDTVAARALEFVVMTACRAGKALGADWSEIDMAGRVWIVPSHRMKCGREHRVPLSDAALAILETIGPRESGRVFGRLGDGAMRRTLQRLAPGQSVHGLRSSFHDFAGDMTDCPRKIAEVTLAHSIGSAIEDLTGV